MEPIDYVRAKIKAAGVRTASLVSRCERLDKNRDGIVHFDDIDNMLSEFMGRKDQLSRREVRVLMMALSNAPERGEVLYETLYDVLDAKKKDTGAGEEWLEEGHDASPATGYGENLRYSQRTLPLVRGPIFTKSVRSSMAKGSSMGRVAGDPAPSGDAYVPRGSIGEWLRKRGQGAETSNFKTFVHALERYERDSGMRIEDVPNGFVVPLGPDLKVHLEFRTT